MIWGSIMLMTVIDCSILAINLFLVSVLYRHYREVRQLGLSEGFNLVLLGLTVIAVFYLLDLLTMHMLPLYVGQMNAMRVMEDLHLNWAWINTFVGIGAIAIGLSRLLRTLVPKAHSSMEQLERQVAERTRELREDVAERERVEDALRDSEERYRNLFEASPIPLREEDWSAVKRLVDQWHGAGITDLPRHLEAHPDTLHEASASIRILDVNRATLDLYQASSKAALIEATTRHLARAPFSSLVGRLASFADERFHVSVENEEITGPGVSFIARITLDIPEEHHHDWSRVYVAIEDVTEARGLSAQLSHQATHDALTDLVNRREFGHRLQRVLETVRNEHTEHALCYLDLDQFKIVNDTCGHMAGDALLKQLGGLLQSQVRKRDTLARLGGDEFALLMEHCSLEQARRAAGSLLDAVTDFRFYWEEKSFNVGVSIGLVALNEGSGSYNDVLSAADAACYAAKEQGRNRVHVFNAGDEEVGKRRADMLWVTRINRALEEEQFRLSFLPIVPLGRGAVAKRSFELLLSMEDEDGELLHPGAFLPAAERYNLSTELDRWVVRTALEWLARHSRELEDLYLCSINLSGQSLSDEEFLAFVMRQFREFEVPASKICFEITETVATARMSSALRFITSLRELGAHFALDDFGSGFSSFGYLKSLPVNFVKIDGQFVKDMADDPLDLAMVKSINDIAHAMNKQTIAEFVESEAILHALEEIGVDYAQGYGIARPALIETMLPVREAI